MKKVQIYTTDGFTVRNEKGDSMGIFSATEVLNDLAKAERILKKFKVLTDDYLAGKYNKKKFTELYEKLAETDEAKALLDR
ncbi:hypothetical protein [Flavobacterium alkalisoli]|uniref:hypothetical protein n=1 Tax=Flavobacterium alkalisoli TaxID=2602769 RepID=UPI003A91E479